MCVPSRIGSNSRGYDSPVSRLTVRHELTCRLATGLSLGGVIPCQLAPTRGCNPNVDLNPGTPGWESSALTTQPIRHSCLLDLHRWATTLTIEVQHLRKSLPLNMESTRSKWLSQPVHTLSGSGLKREALLFPLWRVKMELAAKVVIAPPLS